MNLEQLVSAAQHGDDDAFYQLMLMHKDKLYRVAYAFLRSEQDALEALQEVTYRAYVKLPKLKQPSYVSSWLTRIMIHLCIDEQNRKKRWSGSEAVGEPASQDHADMSDIRLQVEDAIERLSHVHRQIIILKYFEDLTIREIAATLGHPEGTIKTWLHKALLILREDLGKGW
ncbi:RNA polymerase sigma factor [Brevibacillus ruminantium]|uniref:RNA polymerase sigma factor n=1 Tax=Brevibacillus ruminantium TaxID=2950604 RepID=A0ABY4W9R7_9BACL|nr:sigma-70 family RNA polymerase sigma factor [Brevibacillus ruminantium]USG63798.1 RNA polymerase sigma factor [Brevibacillus ruminantium]